MRIYEPRLLSLLDDEGNGLEIFFERPYLSAHSISPNGKKSVFANLNAMQLFEFRERKWYFVAISYSSSRIMHSELKVYVDGVLKQKGPIKVPPALTPYTNCRIGTNAEIQSSTYAIYRENPFYGQMGGLCICNRFKLRHFL